MAVLVAKHLSEKLGIAQLVLDVSGIPKLIDAVLPAESFSQEVRETYMRRLYKQMEENRGSRDSGFFDNLAAALNYRKSLNHMMTSSPKDFFYAIDESKRKHVSDEDVSTIVGDNTFLRTVYLDPHSTSERLHEQLERSLHARNIDQKFLYVDVDSVRQWRALIGSREYKTYEHCAGALKVLLRSEYWKGVMKSGALDCVVDLGVGAGQKDLEIIESFIRLAPGRELLFAIIDTSLPMLEATYQHLVPMLKNSGGRITVKPCKADFMDMHPFQTEIRGQRNTAFFILGNTFANVPENAFMKSVEQASKPGDLLIIGVEFLGAGDGDAKIAQLVKEFDSAGIRGLAVAPIRLLRQNEDIEKIRKAVTIRQSTPREFSNVGKSLAIVISVRFRGEEIVVAYSNRYNESEFIEFVEHFGFKHEQTFPSPDNKNYKQVVFRRASSTAVTPPKNTGATK